jgi:hypothetical protein
VNAKKLALEFLAGLIVSALGFGLFAALLQLPLLSRLETYLGGDKASVFVGLFFGFPIGGVLGIFLLDKIAFKTGGYNSIGIVTGLTLSIILGGIGSVALLSKLGGPAIFIAPFLYVLLALMGYTIPAHKQSYGAGSGRP